MILSFLAISKNDSDDPVKKKLLCNSKTTLNQNYSIYTCIYIYLYLAANILKMQVFFKINLACYSELQGIILELSFYILQDVFQFFAKNVVVFIYANL